MKNLFLCVFLLLCFACKEEKGKVSEVVAFPQTGSLKAAVCSIPQPILLPRYMGVIDDYLFVYKEREENLFAFFTLDKGMYIQDAGSRGQGPNDFNLLDTRSFDTSLGDNKFNVMEAGSNRLKTVKYDGKNLSVLDSKMIFEQGISNNGFYALADSMYMTLGRLEGEKEYCLLDGKTGELVEKEDYPDWGKWEKKENTPPLFVPYLKTCVVHPAGDKIAAFYMRFKRFRIYDKDLNLLRDVEVKINPYFTKFDEPIQEWPEYYSGQPYATERYIYVLCANLKAEGGCHELQIWDWQGRPVACYSFDRKLSMMAISSKYAKIYALDNQVPDELYVYDLPLSD